MQQVEQIVNTGKNRYLLKRFDGVWEFVDEYVYKNNVKIHIQVSKNNDKEYMRRYTDEGCALIDGKIVFKTNVGITPVDYARIYKALGFGTSLPESALKTIIEEPETLIIIKQGRNYLYHVPSGKTYKAV
jgi:hypothetical protein